MIDGHNGWGRLECRPQQHHGQDAENFAPERIAMNVDSQEEDINIVAAEEEVSKWFSCQCRYSYIQNCPDCYTDPDIPWCECEGQFNISLDDDLGTGVRVINFVHRWRWLTYFNIGLCPRD